MAIVKCKPTSPGRRHLVKVVNSELHKGKPYAPLLESKSKSGGRNNNGRITVRHIGGGHKHHYRLIDFKRNKDGIPATVERLEYDPNRSANIALVLYKDGERRYILAPKGLKAGDTILSGMDAPIKAGNSMPMRSMPLGSVIHNVEMKPAKGAQIARSAGTYAQLIAKDGAYVTLRLRSLYLHGAYQLKAIKHVRINALTNTLSVALLLSNFKEELLCHVLSRKVHLSTYTC